jgi:hypothetical protein
MQGQWLGSYVGSNAGEIIVDIDEVGDHFEGSAFLHDQTAGYPGTFARLVTPDLGTTHTLRVDISPVDPISSEPTTWEKIKDKYPGLSYPSSATVILDRRGDQLFISGTTDLGTTASALLPKSRATEPSDYAAQKMDWEAFKKHVTRFDHRRYVFRGQQSRHRLRTLYHRTGRAYIQRFLQEDVPTLQRHLSHRTRHLYDRRDPDQFGAFLNLIQHHGYPTPLLDWTFSPFVAAYFSYRKSPSTMESGPPSTEYVRIFVFDLGQWLKDFPQFPRLYNVTAHLSFMEFWVMDNERMIPQQALSSVTNVDDIERYIQRLESLTGKTYLQIIEMPVAQRSTVMRELSVMGITAGSLFPGLDGACADIRERFFPT